MQYNRFMRRMLFFWVLIGVVLIGEAQLWEPVGGGCNYHTFDLEGFDDQGLLYVCGGFTQAGGVVAHAMATWDGTVWRGLGCDGAPTTCNGYCGEGRTFQLHGGALYLAGNFTWNNPVFSYGHTAYRLLENVWDSCGSPQTVVNFQKANGKLFALGGLHEIQDSIVTNIAIWESPTWRKFGPTVPFNGTSDGTTCVGYYKDQYWFGGNFNVGSDINEVMYLDGMTWKSPGNGILGFSTWINKLVPYKGLLYVGGQFEASAGNADDYLMTWDGSNWQPTFPGVRYVAQVLDLVELQNMLYIVGEHFVWNGSDWDGPYRLARFDGEQFCSFGGKNLQAGQIAMLHADIFITTTQVLDFDTVNWIAKWPQGSPDDICISQPVRMQDPAAPAPLVTLAPNPAQDHITLALPQGSAVADLQIHDVAGRLVVPTQRYRAGEQVDVAALPAGLYFVEVRMRGRVEVLKMIICD